MLVSQMTTTMARNKVKSMTTMVVSKSMTTTTMSYKVKDEG